MKPKDIVSSADPADYIPAGILNFIEYLIFEPGDCKWKDKKNRVVLSFAQDLIYNISYSRIKTQKHLSLSYATRQLTGSKEMITILNNLGHAVSYTDLLRHDTQMVPMTDDFKPDNIDRNNTSYA